MNNHRRLPYQRGMPQLVEPLPRYRRRRRIRREAWEALALGSAVSALWVAANVANFWLFLALAGAGTLGTILMHKQANDMGEE